MPARTMAASEWGLLVLLSLLWGGSFFFIEIAVREIPPVTVVFGRVALAALALVAALRLMGERMPRDREVWGAFLVMGLGNNLVPFSLIFWAMTVIPSGLAAILNAATPFWGVVLAHLLTADERMTPNRVAGVGIGLAGVVLTVGPAALGGIGTGLLAQLAVLAAGACYALAGLYARRFRRLGVTPTALATGQVAVTAVLALPVALLLDRPWTLPPPGAGALAAVAALALVSTAVAYVIYFRLLASAGVTNILLVTMLVPLSAILLGTLFLGERLEARHLAGMAVVAAGLACIDGRPLGWLRRRARV